MKRKGDITLSEHLQKAAKARWALRTPKERSEHSKKMNKKRWDTYHARKKGMAPEHREDTK